MPFKSEKITIQGTKHDRRRKLSAEDKAEIRINTDGLSQRALAREYDVSRRTIQFILDPGKLAANKEARKIRGGWKQYYDKEKHTLSMKEHRNYKQKLFVDGEIKLAKK